MTAISKTLWACVLILNLMGIISMLEGWWGYSAGLAIVHLVGIAVGYRLVVK